MEKNESRTLWAVISFLLVMALIGWAKFIDEKDKAELWYARYSDEADELREVRDSRDYLDITLTEVIRDRDFYKTALDDDGCPQADVPAYCSKGLYQETIEGLRERVVFLEGQLESCTRAYLLGAPCSQRPDGIQCGWDMCLCNDGFEGCPQYVLEYYTDQAVCKTDRNCKSCMWQMVDNGGGLEHDEILWCLEHAYHPR